MICIDLLSGKTDYSIRRKNKGGSTPCCRPLSAHQQRQTGLSTAGVCPFILTVDWLGWLRYFIGYQLSACFYDTRFFGRVFIRMRA